MGQRVSCYRDVGNAAIPPILARRRHICQQINLYCPNCHDASPDGFAGAIMVKTRFLCLMVAAVAIGVGAVPTQRTAGAAATASSGLPPDTVFLEDLTWAEVRDRIKAGWTTVIVGTAGTE